jgi:general stress protein 26
MTREDYLTQKLTTEEARREGLQLMDNAPLCLLGTNDGTGYPQIKAMLKVGNEGLRHVWFSTNTASKRVAQLLRDPKAAVYLYDQANFKGLMLTGAVQVLQDPDTKSRFWVEGCEVYYPLGVADPDYTVLRFDAEWANYYNRLQNVTFPVEQKRQTIA